MRRNWVGNGPRAAALSLACAVGLLISAMPQTADAAAQPGTVNLTRLDLGGVARTPANLLDALGRSLYPDSYGGLRVLGDQGHLQIALTNLDPRVEGAISEAFKGVSAVSFAQAPKPIIDEEAFHQKVLDLVPTLMAEGVDVSSFWPDQNDGLEHIGVTGLTAAQRTLLATALGAANIQVFEQGQIESTSSRTADSAPFYAGDAVAQVGNHARGGCSTGFTINMSGSTYILTAAHCFVSGSTAENVICAGGCGASGTHLGTVTGRDTTSGGEDIELIHASGAGRMWWGTPGASTSVTVDGRASAYVGETVYNSGAYSGTVSSVVDSTNVCITATGYDGSRFECDLDHSVSSGIANQAGDSGGPVSSYSGGVRYALGTVSAASTNATTSCTYNATTCYTDMYFTDIVRTFANDVSGTIVTG